ncbi:MAG: NADH-quinone oxidoreductase subunit C [Nitrospirae bacterium]|nr:NADH-quinone oxidoreductase subunit C [Nitrospirota bacterium]MBF0540792.1 NADH-quinone oxidoreductase subunit C [Nitrospirota bacterium]
MENWITVKNGQSVALENIPSIPVALLCDEIERHIINGLRPIQFFGRPKISSNNTITLTAVLADDNSGTLLISTCNIEKNASFQSMTPKTPSIHLFEREILEQTGVRPEGHPFLKPVRYEFGKEVNTGKLKDYPYLTIGGDETHEVAVGPVHAGVIEPGSFRFLCHGEKVYHLEIQLGYQHRGVEALLRQGNPLNKSHIVESIAGDTTIAHTWCYAMSLESLMNVKITKEIEIIRVIALELERIAMHLVGLGGISMDIGYLPGASFFGRLRTIIINTSMRICGSRFGKGMIRPAASIFKIDDNLKAYILEILDKLHNDIEIIKELFFNSAGVLARLEKTGIVTTAQAKEAGLLGIMAKMAELPQDSRASHPFGLYNEIKVEPCIYHHGDVCARAIVRGLEIDQSMDIIRKALELYDSSKNDAGIDIGAQDIVSLQPSYAVVSMVEGWRGEVSHMIITDKFGQIEHYKVVDTSFHNWFGLALAVRNNGISDFPLCNKSFDQSYCGYDL